MNRLRLNPSFFSSIAVGSTIATLLNSACVGFADRTPLASPTPLVTPSRSLDADVCEDLASPKKIEINAAAEASSAPALTGDHARNVVRLRLLPGIPELPSSNGGFVKFQSPKQGDWIFFLTASVSMKIFDATGKRIAPSESADSSADCPSIKGRHRVALNVGVHTVDLGPTKSPSVEIVVEEGGPSP